MFLLMLIVEIGQVISTNRHVAKGLHTDALACSFMNHSILASSLINRWLSISQVLRQHLTRSLASIDQSTQEIHLSYFSTSDPEEKKLTLSAIALDPHCRSRQFLCFMIHSQASLWSWSSLHAAAAIHIHTLLLVHLLVWRLYLATAVNVNLFFRVFWMFPWMPRDRSITTCIHQALDTFKLTKLPDDSDVVSTWQFLKIFQI